MEFKNTQIKIKYASFFHSIFHCLQLLDFKSYTFTYLLADKKTKEAILIDPVIETVERDIRLLNDHQLKLICAGQYTYFYNV